MESTRTAPKNGEEAEQVEFQFDLDELREALGVPALEAEVEMLRSLLSETLTYINYVDLSLQELQGEGVVTESMQYNVGRGGRIQAQRRRPPAPPNLTKEKLELLQGVKKEA
jgi:hypothetical protein